MRKKIEGSCERRERRRKWFVKTNSPTESKIRLKLQTRETLKMDGSMQYKRYFNDGKPPPF
jgi:hypothetical protein